MKQLAAGRTELKLGSLSPVRDLNFVEDTVRGFLAIGSSERAIGETMNIGSGQAISIGELAQVILDVTGKKATITSDDARVRPDASEVMVLLADNAKAKRLVGYAPRVSLKEGLRRTYEYVEAHLGDYRVDEYAV
jgi:UDP-glucose 4-epimerase